MPMSVGFMRGGKIQLSFFQDYPCQRVKNVYGYHYDDKLSPQMMVIKK